MLCVLYHMVCSQWHMCLLADSEIDCEYEHSRGWLHLPKSSRKLTIRLVSWQRQMTVSSIMHLSIVSPTTPVRGYVGKGGYDPVLMSNSLLLRSSFLHHIPTKAPAIPKNYVRVLIHHVVSIQLR